MSNYPFFYNSVNGDRKYDADSFSNWLKKFFTTGVFVGDLQVTANDNMSITISGGYANIDGKVMMWEEPTTLDITTANATYNRIDTVVVERNDTDRQFYIKVITGSATDTPTANTPVRTKSIHQLVLAEIHVPTGATSITQADITDKRPDTEVCGFVAATVKQIDFSQIQAQYDAYMANYKQAVADDYQNYKDTIAEDHAGFRATISDYTDLVKKLYQSWQSSMSSYQNTAQSDFEKWLESVKGKMDGDVGTKLAADSTDHENKINFLMYEITHNRFTAPLIDSNGNPVKDTDGNYVLGSWKYKTM